MSLDLPSEAAQAEGDPEAFLARHPEPLIIDEVQYAPALFRHLKLRVDQDRERCGRFLLTGSQPFVLMRDVADSLAGRAAIVTLEGLSLGEIRAVEPQVAIETMLLRGGFPELWAQRAIDPAEFYASYVATYLERDLRSLLQESSLHDFERFLRACALRSAQLLNRAELARDVGISGSTAAIWLSLLVGLASPDALMRSPLRGALWETAVLSELRRELALRPLSAQLAFWRDRSRAVDVLLERGGRFWLADCKWSASPGSPETRRLRQVSAELPQGSVQDLAIACRTNHRHPLGDGIQALPQ